MGHAWGSTLFGLNKILFIHRNHKFNKEVQETQKQYAYLSVTYGQNDNYTVIYDGMMANWCQKVRGKKTKPKQQQNITGLQNQQLRV